VFQLFQRLVLAVSFALAGLLAPPAHAAGETAVFDDLLARYVTVGRDGVSRVRYAAWAANAADKAMLDRYVESLAKTEISKLPRNAQFAAWANLYNAVTLQVVLKAYPVKSIRDIKSAGVGLDLKALVGPWVEKRVTVEGRELSLDDIEHVMLRPRFDDPRVHYAVNCASFGCPNLPTRAWRAETLDADLDAAARAFVNHPRGVTVRGDGGLALSSIYDWFKGDFGGTDAGVRAHLARYAGPELAAALAKEPKIKSHAYDWRLNDAGPKS